MSHLPRALAASIVLALAAACTPPDAEPFLDDELGTADAAASAAVACPGESEPNRAVCSGTALVDGMILRAGASATAHAEVAQTFTLPRDGWPGRVLLKLRPLRRLPAGVDPWVYVDVREFAAGAVPDESATVARGRLAWSALVAGTNAFVLANVDTQNPQPLVAGRPYAFVLRVDAVASAQALVGVATHRDHDFTGGSALRRSSRGSAGTFVPGPFIPVPNLDLSFAVTLDDGAAVNECLLGLDDCHANAICTDTVAGFTCACGPGYTGNGRTCDDENECARTTPPCDANATCENAIGSYACACHAGYTGSGASCTDVDECATACTSNGTCVNTAGTFTCTCASGYAFNAATGQCADVDECATKCTSNGTCANTAGSFTCTCASGYTFNGTIGQCVDVNECLTNNGGCHADATCANSLGSRTCTCAPGLTGDGISSCACSTDSACGASRFCHASACTPVRASCLGHWTAGLRTNTSYVIRPTDTDRRVYCDMSGGGWTRVVNIQAGSIFHGDQPAAVGDVSNAAAAAKLSDAEINAISTVGYWNYFCGSYTGFVKNDSNTWTSARTNPYYWRIDRNKDGSYECAGANRGGYVFSDYNIPACSAGHSNYVAITSGEGNGCYNAAQSWNQSGSLWAK